MTAILRLTRELDRIIALRGKPFTIVSDNGTEMTSRAVLRWSAEQAIDWHYIAPGRPHGALGNRTPAAFAAASVLAMQRGEAIRYPRGFAPRPVAPQALMGSNAERTQAPTG
jgi:hypothetical protein